MRLAIVAATLLVMAGAGEIATRVIFRHVTTSSDVRSYFSRRWGSSGAVRVNHLGFREREFPKEKPPNIYRIAVIGDSFTYGNGAAEQDRLTNLLDKDCAGHGCEVLNFGTPGNSTPDNTETLRKVVLEIDPDFVLLAWFTNDPEVTAPPDRPPHLLPLLPWPNIERQLYRNSALFSLMKIRWADFQLLFMAGAKDPYAQYMRKRFGDPNSPDAREADTEIRKFIATCKARHVGVGILLWPHLGMDLGSAYPLDFLHTHVLATCADEQIACVDVRTALAAERDRRKLWSSPLDSHPGLEANQIAEREVLQTFGRVWLDRRNQPR